MFQIPAQERCRQENVLADAAPNQGLAWLPEKLCLSAIWRIRGQTSSRETSTSIKIGGISRAIMAAQRLERNDITSDQGKESTLPHNSQNSGLCN
ncbi:hypothetical protein PoB_005550200 [Plakobranchus ocellatus]|uniref:Uncharacterized protein n=1 Tax=Plakobranchus ocellatus TaxID=259542 RepID=A0AAV4CCT7_9GAST|nr:hypothetical protein PoB_005550200 [Plakobranchus ocellatus]